VFATLAAYCQANTKMFFYCSSNIADLQPGSGLDLVRQAAESLVRCFYYGNALLNGAAAQQTQIFAAAYAGRALSTNFEASGSSTTMNMKQLVTITPDQTLNQTYLNQADAAGVDVYASFNGFSCLKTSGANAYFDQAYQRQWLVYALQTAGFNYLVTVGTKIPQTEDGMNGLKDAYIQILKQAVANGYLAAGLLWNSATSFGNRADLVRNVLETGYYIYSLPINQQTQAARQARQAPVVQIAAQEGGAIHSSAVIVAVEP
jgi:phosphoheptose isomerase